MSIVTQEGVAPVQTPALRTGVGAPWAATCANTPRSHKSQQGPDQRGHRPRPRTQRHQPATCSRRGPCPTRSLRRARFDYVLVDGTIAGCDRVGDRETHYSGKARRHGVNIPAVTGPAGELIWYAPALPGRTVDITAARTHRIITTCERLRLPVLADKAYPGADGTFQILFKRHLGRALTREQANVNPATCPTPASRRAGLRPPQVLAHLPRSQDEPEPNDVDREGRAFTLKRHR